MKHCVYSITSSGNYIFYTIINEDMTSIGKNLYGDGEERDINEFCEEFENYAKNELGVTIFTSLYID